MVTHMKSTVAAEALVLADEILKDIELSRCPLTETCLKAVRLARLTGEVEMSQIFMHEASGYPSTPNGIPADTFDLCRKAGRVFLDKDSEKGEALVERASTASIDQILSSIETFRTRLEFSRPQAVNIVSANPNQYVNAPFRNITLENGLSSSLTKAVGSLSSRRTFIYDYALSKHLTLNVSSAAEDIFEEYRQRSDALIIRTIPEELKRLESISENLRSENKEDWANAVHSCRRLLQAVADAVYPAQAGVTVKSNGHDIKIGPDNYINRLVLFCESKQNSKIYEAIVGSNLSYLGNRLDSLFAAAQKGSHAEVSRPEANRCVIQTYLAVGDILTLLDSNLNRPDEIKIAVQVKESPDEVVDGSKVAK
ncbi:hypothetical protein [Tabrizicola piscis]|uniref:AbiTii domain-containing protein n=1 Tax=Tabrizicola piscis TaxID=2494374 RepID=UPI0013DE182F|nr:hypothetical protein [Tabrizicola piscis]